MRKGRLFAEIYVLIIIIVAAITTFSVYPFIGLSDGFVRWGLTNYIFEGPLDTLYSPIIPIIQRMTYDLTNSYGFYTFMECVWFYLAIGILNYCLLGEKGGDIKRFIEIPYWFVLSVLVLTVPTFRVFPTMITDSAPMFYLTVFMIFVFKVFFESHKILCGILESILIILCISIRVNSALMILGGIVLWVLISYIMKNIKLKWIPYIFAMCISVLIGMKLPSAILQTNYNAATLGMVWELTGLAYRHPELTDLREELGQYGDIELAVQRYGEPYLNAIVWDNNPPFKAMEIAGEEKSGEIMSLYIKTFFDYPIAFIENKWQYVDSTLGISNPLITSARGIHMVDEISMTYGTTDTLLQWGTRSLFINFTDRIGIISLRPIVLMAGSFLLLLILSFWKKLYFNLSVYWGTLLLGQLYYVAFLINTQAYEFRYYAPTFFICTLVSACALTEVLHLCIFENKYLKKYVFRGKNDEKRTDK